MGAYDAARRHAKESAPGAETRKAAPAAVRPSSDPRAPHSRLPCRGRLRTIVGARSRHCDSPLATQQLEAPLNPGTANTSRGSERRGRRSRERPRSCHPRSRGRSGRCTRQPPRRGRSQRSWARTRASVARGGTLRIRGSFARVGAALEFSSNGVRGADPAMPLIQRASALPSSCQRCNYQCRWVLGGVGGRAVRTGPPGSVSWSRQTVVQPSTVLFVRYAAVRISLATM